MELSAAVMLGVGLRCDVAVNQGGLQRGGASDQSGHVFFTCVDSQRDLLSAASLYRILEENHRPGKFI